MSPKNNSPLALKKFIVLGVHRSGTSIVSNLIEKMGVWFGYENDAMDWRNDNPKGFWERRDVVDLNDQILSSLNLKWHSLVDQIPPDRIDGLAEQYAAQIKSVLSKLDKHTLWFIKDPRLILTWPVWEKFIQDPYYICVCRNPLSVSQSLLVRNAMPLNYGYAFWLTQTKAMANILKNAQSKVVISHDQLLSSPRLVTDKLFQALSSITNQVYPLSKTEFDEIFDSSLVHHRFDRTDFKANHALLEHYWGLFAAGDFEKLANTEIPIKDFVDQFHINAWEELYSRELHIRELEFSLVDKNRVIEDKNRVIEDKNRIIESNCQKIVNLSAIIARYRSDLNNIADSLIEYRNATSYKLSTIPRTIKGKFNSKDSLTALDEMQCILEHNGCQFEAQVNKHLGGRIFDLIRDNPRQLLKDVSFKRIKTVIKMVKDPQARLNLDQSLFRYEKATQDKSLILFKPSKIYESLIELPHYDNPSVSIIVPVYNEYQTTLACLKSVEEFTDDVSYEVIVADDNSTDATNKIKQKIANLRVIRSEVNQGFLKNCNNAAQHARGKYVLLLNNDTNVQENWLSELLGVIQADNEVGLVGSKLIYPDGRLQEAGGIIFKDGSGWNYGRLDDPQRPEYCFIRNVDYISGACILIRKKIWDQLGGFDERFSPAYYEDTDICFSVREMGYKVIFTPFSKVIHYEGVSHGTDEAVGVKRHQKENKEVFREKWANTLDLKHEVNEKSLFLTRHAGEKTGTVLVIDHYVPMHDKDAGSRSTRKYLELLVQSKVRLIFLGDNFYPHQPYTEQLQRLGIEVLYGDYYQKNLSAWLHSNAQFIDCIYIHRPHIAEKFSKLLNSLNPCPRLVYFGHDLHYLRCYREYEITGDKKLLEQSKLLKDKETNIISNMDLSLYPAQYEVDALKEIDPNYNVDAIPLMWFDDEEISHASDLQNSMQILFVGGFGHPPNIDGLIWFIHDIWPKLVEQHNNVTLTIIGSKCPTQIKKLHSSNINVLGEVDDKTLAQQYNLSRLAIVPLRFGAGIKGKILEAMAWGVPVCTTSIGADGLPTSEGEYILQADTAIAFKDNVSRLLLDNDLQTQLVYQAHKVIRNDFSKGAAKKLLVHLIGS